MANNYKDVIGLQEISNDYLFAGNGDVTIGFKLMLPEVFHTSTDEANKLHNHFVNLLSSSPKGTYYHWQHFIYQDTYYSDFNDKLVKSKLYDLKHFNERPVMRHYCNMYVTFPVLKKETNGWLQAKDFILGKPFKDAEKRVKEISGYAMNIEHYLEGMDQISSIKMNSNELYQEIKKYLTLDFGNAAGGESLEPYSREDDAIKVGDKYATVVSLVDEGGYLTNSGVFETINPEIVNDDISFNNKIKLPTSMMYPLGIGLAFDHILNIGIQVLDNELVRKDLSKSMPAYNLMAALNFPSAVEKKKSIQDYLDLLEKENMSSCKTFVNVIVTDSTKESLTRKASFVKQTFLNMNNSSAWVENVENSNYFFASTPGLVRGIDRTFYSIVNMATCYLHNETYYKSSPEGFLYVDRHGNPVNINIRNFEGKTNNNGLIFGPSGTGKSHLCQGFIDNCLSNGEQVVLINVKPDYINSAKMNGGEYIDTNKPGEIGLNPFYDVEKDTQGRYNPNNDDYTILKSIIGECWKGDKGLDLEADKVLENYIAWYYNKVNKTGERASLKQFYLYADDYKATLSDTNLRFFDFDSFKLVMKDFANGRDEGFLNSTKDFKISNNKYVVFDLFGLKGDEKKFRIFLNYIVHLGRKKIMSNFKSGNFTNLIIDEAVDSMKGKAADFIAEQFRTMRSLNGGIILATQGVRYFDGMDELVRNSIFSNAQIRIILDHSADRGSIPDLQKNCSIDNYGISLLNSLSGTNTYREFLMLLGGDYSVVLRNEVSQETNLFYSTSDKVVKKLEAEFYRTRNMDVAIKNIINE